MQDECAAAFAGGLRAQNGLFRKALNRGSGGSGGSGSRRHSGRSSGGDWRDGVLGEVWVRKGRFVWVRREGGGAGRIDGVGGVTRERVVGGWREWNKSWGRRLEAWRERKERKRVEKELDDDDDDDDDALDWY